MFSKIAVLAILVVAASARQILVQNTNQNPLTVSVSGQSTQNLLPGAQVILNVADNWSGQISAHQTGCSECASGPQTAAAISLGPTDNYAVSVVDGYNVGIKVVPINGANCESAVCKTSLGVCPLADQVRNSLGQVVACKNSPLIMAKVCPNAIVTEGNALNIKTCSALGYKVLIG